MKYFIVGLHAAGKQEVIDNLEGLEVKCGKIFSNLEEPSPEVYNSENYELYTDEDINTIFESGAYIFMQEVPFTTQNRDISKKYEGLSKYTFDENQVFVLSPDQFLSISPNSVKDDICIVWMDSTKSRRISRFNYEDRSYNYALRDEIERKDLCMFTKSIYTFNNSPVIYFADEEPSRVSTIIYNLITHPDMLDLFVKNFN